MPLIEDYLRAVGFLLPKAQREDIIAELRDVILTRVEGREGELGRPLTPDETEAVLREVGHPVVVAARYRGGPQHVIGPALYPYWWFGVKTAVTVQVLIAALAFVLRALAGGDIPTAFGRAMGAAVNGSLVLIGCATAAAWIIERRGVHIDYLDRWRVRDLRFLQFTAWDWDTVLSKADLTPPLRMRRGRRRRSPASRGLGGIVAGAILALWCTGMLHVFVIGDLADLRDLGLEPGALTTLHWPDLRAALLWPVLAYALMLMLQGVALIAWPDRIRLHALWDIAIGALVLAVAGWLWTASPLAPSTAVESLAGFVRLMKVTTQNGPPYPLPAVMTFVLAVTAVGAVFRIVRGIWALVAWPRATHDPLNGSANPA